MHRCHPAGLETRADAPIKKATRFSAPVPCSKGMSKAACTNRGSFPSVSSSCAGVKCHNQPSPKIFLLSFMLCGTLFIVKDLSTCLSWMKLLPGLLMLMLVLFGLQISKNVLDKEGWNILTHRLFLVSTVMGANLNLNYRLNTKQELLMLSEGDVSFIVTRKYHSMGVLGQGTEIRCIVCHPRRHSAFLMSSPGLPREGLCQQDSVYSFCIHSHYGSREELKTPQAPDLPREYGFRESVFLSLMTSLGRLGRNKVGRMLCQLAHTQSGLNSALKYELKVQTTVLHLKLLTFLRSEWKRRAE